MATSLELGANALTGQAIIAQEAAVNATYVAVGAVALCSCLLVILVVLLIKQRKERRRWQFQSNEHTEYLVKTLDDLSQIKERYDLILDYARTGIVELNKQGDIVSCNGVGAELLGATVNAIVGNNFHALAHHSHPDGRPYPQADCPMHRAVIGGRSMSVSDEVLWRLDGTPFDSTYEAVPLFDNDAPSGAMVIFRDISEQARYQRELLASKEELSSAVQAKTDFLAKVTHEIRTPLQALQSLLHMARRAKRKSHANRHIRTAERSLDYVGHIIDDILDFSKIEAGMMVLDSGPFALRESLEVCREMLLTRAQSYDVKLLFSVHSDVPRQLIGDVHRLAQVVINLVGNAIKFSYPGSTVELDVSVLISQAQQIELVFSVIDTGVGMSPEEQEGLFESYTQASPSVARKYGGSGLGLAISKQLVELMGGDIHVQSAKGMGSTFTFTASFGVPETQVLPPKPVVSRVDVLDDDSLAGVYLLLVEDNIDSQQAVKELLEAEGAVVFTANNGQQALEKLQSYAVDGILMDCRMPVMDGFTATAEIRRQPKYASMPIIAMTGSAAGADIEAARAAGMNEYLVKPVDPTTLIAQLGHWLRNR